MESITKQIPIILITILLGIGTALNFIWMVVRLPIRLFYCRFRGHEWMWLGGGFFAVFTPKRNFKCVKCGFRTQHPDKHKTVKYQRG